MKHNKSYKNAAPNRNLVLIMPSPETSVNWINLGKTNERRPIDQELCGIIIQT